MTGTDLPFPQSGNSGSNPRADEAARRPTVADLMTALDQTLMIPSGPPLHECDPRTVIRWVEAASEAFVIRRDRTRLVREVLRVLDEEWATAVQVERLQEHLAAREEERRERAAGTYWQRRERGRRAKQATRVEVDPDAWVAAKARARELGLGVGEYVGQLVKADVGRAGHEHMVAAPRGRGVRRERYFARVAVDKDTWTAFVARSREVRIAVARHLGVVVEAAVRQGDP